MSSSSSNDDLPSSTSSNPPPSSSSNPPPSSSSSSSSAVSTTSSVSQSISASTTASVSASASASITSAPSTTSAPASSEAVSVSNGQTVVLSSVVVTVTDSNGDVTTQTSGVARPVDKHNNTGAIVGGVVGGVCGLILILAVLWILIKKRSRARKMEFDDNMFDPGRAQNRASVDLADPAPNTVEPFYAPGVASTNVSPEMTQYPRSAATSESGGGYQQDLSRGPSSASSAGFAGRGAGAYGLGQGGQPPLPSIPAGVETGAGAGLAAGAGAAMTAKQREAYHEQQRFHVANQQQNYGPSGSGASGGPPMSPTETSSSGGPVTVHEDAGAVNASEIPPTYDSIRR